MAHQKWLSLRARHSSDPQLVSAPCQDDVGDHLPVVFDGLAFENKRDRTVSGRMSLGQAPDLWSDATTHGERAADLIERPARRFTNGLSGAVIVDPAQAVTVTFEQRGKRDAIVCAEVAVVKCAGPASGK